ncbi:hypothetical protein VTO42DRAFT_6079 [Malbranchea cinnamomea]
MSSNGTSTDPEPSSVVDLRSLEIVSDYSGHLMCAVCHCPFIRPIRLRCDHIFCQTCLDDCIRSAQTLTSFSPPSDNFLCPTCRTPTNASFQTVPRLVMAMCDEIVVKCPFAKEGCEETIQRGHVQAHVDKHCDYRLVRCPDTSCDKKIRKRDLDADGKCLHTLCQCQRCGESVMQLEYQSHTTETCPKLATSCPDCEASLTRQDLSRHMEECPRATKPCQGAAYGCQVRLGRSEIEDHQKSCTFATLRPYLEGQSSRIASMDLTIRQLRQRNEILEEGIASIRSSLAQMTPRPLSETPADISTLTRNDAAPVIRDPPNEAASLEQDASNNTPSSSTTTYLLAIHESLREEVARLSSALNDVDARASMSIMNENLRIREDMAHINAAINTVRMQVHMLMNLRFHQGQRTEPARATQAPSSGDTLGVANNAGPSRLNGPMPEALRGRRLSDSGREGTKL